MIQTKSYIDFIWRKDAMVEIPEKRKRKIQNLANKGCEVKELKDYTGGKKMKKFFDKTKRKRIINCYSKAEMERLHDSYIERGVMAEELICVIPYSTVNVYKLIVEE